MENIFYSKIGLTPGYYYGLRLPSLRFAFRSDERADKKIIERITDFRIHLNIRSNPTRTSTAAPASSIPEAITSIIEFMADISIYSRLPIRQRGLAMNIKGDFSDGTHYAWLVFIPILPESSEVASKILRLLITDQKSEKELMEKLDRLVSCLRATIPGGANGLHLMNAALSKGIPFEWLGANILQFGQGAKARLMEGSFTDSTSRIGTAIARNKLLTSALLRQHGLPVAPSEGVNDVDAAVSAASRIGYPVVVKPADLDGGIAVHAGLVCPDQVRAAARNCLSYSPNMMVEKWIAGRDYRLVVFEGSLIWAIERVPGGVLGDGDSTVEELVAIYNRDPMRGSAPHLPLKPLDIDEEALELLSEVDFSPASIPKAGMFVRLRRAANIARGGHARPAFDEVHPDNRELAERAARALNLDLAGIDLIIPDIGRSWLNSEAAICEVNAQPDIGFSTSAHIYPQLLDSLIRNNGRIPVILVIGDDEKRHTARAICNAISELGANVGFADCNGTALNGRRITKAAASCFAAGRVLIRDRRTDCAVICINDCSVLDTGLPVDLYDIAVLAGDNISGPAAPAEEVLKVLLRAIAPSCLRSMFIKSSVRIGDIPILNCLNAIINIEEYESNKNLGKKILNLIL